MELVRNTEPKVSALKDANGKMQIYVDQYRLFGVLDAQIGMDPNGNHLLVIRLPLTNITIGEAPRPPVLEVAGDNEPNPFSPWVNGSAPDHDPA